MSDEQIQAIQAAFARAAEVFAEFIEVARQQMAQFVRSVMPVWRALCRSHVIPRQYRNTMMRRKVYRYTQYIAIRS